MVSAGTIHVVSTELTVGSFAMAGAAFVCFSASSALGGSTASPSSVVIKA